MILFIHCKRSICSISILILIIFIIVNSPLVYAENATRTSSSGKIHQENRFILVPFSNPLHGYDANTITWFSATQLLNTGADFLADKTNLKKSVCGRVSHLILILYLSHAASYYSHEVAHQINNKRKNQHFWLDLSDWSQLVPKFVFNNWKDKYDVDNYLELRRVLANPEVKKFHILKNEAGFYQNLFNSRLINYFSEIYGNTSIEGAVFYIYNHIMPFVYHLRWGLDPVIISRFAETFVRIHGNDVTGYIYYMNKSGIHISRDDWLYFSGLAFFLSGHTINAVRSLYNYLAEGDESTRNVRIPIGSRTSLSMPNFYLYPSILGLYLETEFCLSDILKAGNRLFITLGTGLDSFGARRTGPVDNLRVGGEYYCINIRIAKLAMALSPWGYLHFTQGNEHLGHSIGVNMLTELTGPFRLFTRLEHSREDMIEQVIKNKEEGFNMMWAMEVSW